MCDNGPTNPEARQIFILDQRRDPTYKCLDCGHYWNDVLPVWSSRCPKCRSWHKDLAYPWAFEWDKALMAYVAPHEPCGNDGRICSVGDCSICQLAGHDEVIDLAPPDTQSVPF